jgi:hypothetical protein
MQGSDGQTIENQKDGYDKLVSRALAPLDHFEPEN